MGYRDDMKAMADCQRIKRNGGTAKFSIASITTMSISLPDAKKRLTGEEFDQVYALFKRLRKCKSKIELDIDGYHDLAARIVLMFDNIAPYEKYSGMDEIEGELLIATIREIYGNDPGFADDIVKEIARDGTGGRKPKKRWGLWFLCIALAVAVCVLGYMVYQQNAGIATLETSVESAQRMQKRAEDIVRQVQAEKSNLYTENYKLRSENRFWENSAVIVIQAGGRYHRHGCPHTEGKSFWIYNVEAAQSLGCTPCLDCKPPDPQQTESTPPKVTAPKFTLRRE